MDQWRKRDDLKRALTDANSTYETHRNRTLGRGSYHLNAHFGLLDGRAAKLPPGKTPAHARLGIEQLFLDVADAKGEDALTEVQARVNTLVADVATWASVATMVEKLKQAVDGLPATYGPRKELEELVTEEPVTLSGEEAIKSHQNALYRFDAVIALFRRLFDAWEAAAPGPDEPDQRPPDADPHQAYATAKDPIERTEGDHDLLTSGLRDALEELQSAGVTTAVAGPTDIGGAGPAAGAGARRRLTAARRAQTATPGLRARFATRVKKLWSRERVEWTVWWFTFAIAVVAFTLTVYVGKDFGGFGDYMAAFVAGFTGAAVANVGIVPLARALGTTAV